jgi:hypothetical protein
MSFVTAKPKITVNYVAEYNRMSRPQDYDPNERYNRKLWMEM